MAIEPWTRESVAFDLVDDQSAGSIATVAIRTPAGEIKIMAEIVVEGRAALLRGTHIQSDAGPNAIGIGR